METSQVLYLTVLSPADQRSSYSEATLLYKVICNLHNLEECILTIEGHFQYFEVQLLQKSQGTKIIYCNKMNDLFAFFKYEGTCDKTDIYKMRRKTLAILQKMAQNGNLGITIMGDRCDVKCMISQVC